MKKFIFLAFRRNTVNIDWCFLTKNILVFHYIELLDLGMAMEVILIVLYVK